jgi:4-hydroxybenzoate polyprenyltransferase
MLRQVQMLAGAVMGALVMIAIVLGIAFPEGERLDAPPLWLVAAQVLAAVAVHIVVEAVGYRAPAIHPETSEAEARTISARAFTSGTVLRVGLCESIALASAAAAFLVDSGGYAGFLTGAAISLALMAVHAWPGAGPIEKTRVSLEREGGRSYLREQLGLAQVGPIQEL